MTFTEFAAEVRRLGPELANYVADRERLFGESWNKKPDASSLTQAANATKQILNQRFDILQTDLAGICSAYLELTEKGQCRELVGGYPELLRQLFNHLGWQSERIGSKAEQNLAMIGLAAISLADMRGVDTRDLLIAMGQVYIRLYRVGVFLSVPLVRISEISNPLPRAPQRTSMRDFFLNFEESAYFKGSVEPKLV